MARAPRSIWDSLFCARYIEQFMETIRDGMNDAISENQFVFSSGRRCVGQVVLVINV